MSAIHSLRIALNISKCFPCPRLNNCRFLSSGKDSEVMQEVERVMASPELMAKLPETDVTREVNRVMAEPEINGQPVLLNFAKGEKTKGYSRVYAAAHDRIFAKKKET